MPAALEEPVSPDPDGTPDTSERTEDETRKVTDPLAMRALAHPVRIELLELLTTEGPMTATEAGERIGESPTTCSFHLRQLAKYGFVEEAGGGAGRRRPWKTVNRHISFSGMGGAEQTVAARELSTVLMGRWFARHEQWREVELAYPEWAEVTGASQFVAFLTPEEQASVQAEIRDLFGRFEDRLDPVLRPPGSRQVETVVLSHLRVSYGVGHDS